MRRLFAFILLVQALPAAAQTVSSPQPYYAPQTNQQVSGNYYPNIPATAPQPAPQYQPQPAPQPVQAAPQAQPWDYGQSVKTDVRQMNF